MPTGQEEQAMWNTIKDLVNSKSIDDMKRLFSLLVPKLGLQRVEELAAMEPPDLAALMTKVLGDIPLTQWDDQLRLATAEKLIRYARKEMAERKQTSDALQPLQQEVVTAQFSVKGTIKREKGPPPAFLTVRAFDQGPSDHRVLLGETRTDTGGRYDIGYNRDQLIDPTKGIANLVVEVLDSKDERLAISDVKLAPGSGEVIDLTTGMNMEKNDSDTRGDNQELTFSVHGVVTEPNGRPVATVNVHAFHQTLHTQKPLGRPAVSDDSGRYSISYSTTEVKRLEIDRVNLVVRVVDSSNILLGESPIHFRAKASERIDVIIDREDRSFPPFERILKRLAPLLNGAALADMGKRKIAFLAGESGIAAVEIARAVRAERASRATHLSAAAFYGYLAAREERQGRALVDFSDQFASDYGLRSDEMIVFRFIAPAGELVDFDPLLVDALITRWQAKEMFSAYDLVLWEVERWQTLLEAAWPDEAASLPAWASGSDREEQLSNAAAFLVSRASQIFPANELAGLLVSGRIETPSRRPTEGVWVQAFHQDLDSQTPISPKTETDASGNYRMVLDPEVLKQRVPSLERLPLQLRLNVWDGSDDEPVGRSEIIPGPKLPLKRDITLSKEVGPPEFARISARVQRVLGDTPVQSVSDDRIDWLATVSGIDPATTRQFLTAYQIAGAAKLPAEVLYAHLHPALKAGGRGESLKDRLGRAVDAHLANKDILDHLEALAAWEAQRRREAHEREIKERIESLRQPPPAGQPPRPVDLLRAANIDPSALEAFMRRTAETPDADPKELIHQLEATGMARQPLADMATALRLAELVGPEPTLVADLMPEVAGSSPEATADERLAPLARIGADAWVERLRRLRPDDAPERHGRRARAIERRLERLHPVEALMARLDERRGDDTFRILQDYRGKLRRIDLHGRGLAFQEQSAVLGALPEGMRSELDALQRLARIAPFREALTLRKLGFDSARAIAATPADGFVEAFLAATPPGSAARAGRREDAIRQQARVLHRRAKLQTGRALAAAGALAPTLTAADPFVLHGGQSRASANLETLFGSLDACSVVPCESVLGTPAYLVDLLELLGTAAPRPAHPNPQKVLLQRRPDIVGIELSCANADTPLPQIDLTIELLEDATLGREPQARQTSWSAEELIAHPEHLQAEAYRILDSDQAAFPWTLPFSLAQAEADLYLEDLGTNRAALMASQRTATPTQQQALAEACAELGLPPNARKALLGALHTTRPWRFWGYDGDTAPAGWPAVVGGDVRLLLDRTGLAHPDLLELLASGFVNPDRTVVLVVADGADACDLSAARLQHLDAAFLDRLHRFTRLQWRLGCSVRELDHAIDVLGQGRIDADLLVALAAARRVARRLKRSLAEVLPLWGDIDTQPSVDRSSEPLRQRPSQYARLLLEKSRLTTEERQRLTPPFDATVAPADLQAVVARALGIDDVTLTLLTTVPSHLGLNAPAVNATTPLDLISALYRWQLLAEATMQPIGDLLQLQALSGIDPFASPGETLAFLDGRDGLQRNGIRVAELDFSLRHVGDSDRNEHFNQQQLRRLRRLRRQLIRQSGESAAADFDPDVVAELLAHQLAQDTGLAGDTIRALIQHISDTSGFGAPLPELLGTWLAEVPQAPPTDDGTAWRAFNELVKSARLLAHWGLAAEAVPLRPHPLPTAVDPQQPSIDRRARFVQWQTLAAQGEAARQSVPPSLAEQLGLSPVQLSRWAADDIDLVVSGEIRSVAAARAAEQPWAQRAPGLRHRLRVQQRDALLAFVKQNRKATHLDVLHTHFLADLEMGSHQLTTRIAFATAAVQSFVQRALLSHETAADGRTVVLSEEVAARWEWMGSNERWLGARKRFLYPENFLTPEVRPGKSSFFEEFEQQLAQRALTVDAIEDAVGQYLEKLEEVARLEIMGTCVEQVDGESVLHIIGRTRSLPHVHYHRRWFIDGGGFTPWEKIDLGIDGDWVVPVVFAGRLTLYWIKHSRQIEGMSDIIGLIPARPFPLVPHYPMFQDQYTLAWSRRERRGWGKQEVAQRPIARPFNPLMPAQFAVRLDGQRLRIAGVTPLPQLPPLLQGDEGKGAGKSLAYEADPGCMAWHGAHSSQAENTSGQIKGPKDQPFDISDFLKDPLSAIPEILQQLQSLQDELNDALTTIPDLVWQSLSKRIGELAGDAWQQLPQDFRRILCFLGEQIDNALGLLNPPGEIPGRILNGGTQFLAQLVQVFHAVLQLIAELGLKVFLKDDLIENLRNVLSDLQRLFDLSGMAFAVEFGFFDLRPGNIRSVRLTAPSPEMVAAAVGTAGAVASPFLLPALPLLASNVGLALLPSLVALGESARLLYSMFPGYPAFHDLPLQTSLLHTRLPLLTDGSRELDWRIRAWPTSGYLLLPGQMKGRGGFNDLTIAINLQRMAAEELKEIEEAAGALTNELFSGFITGDQSPSQKVRDLANDTSNLLETISDAVDETAAMLGVGLRVVRPVPFGPYPGRLIQAAPVILGEERHGRTFLLHQRMGAKGPRWQAIGCYHPLTSILGQAFDRHGVEGLYAAGSNPKGAAWIHEYRLEAQRIFTDTFWVHPSTALPSGLLDAGPKTQERLDVSQGGAYAAYNWELFYHMPMLVASRLARQQSFREAIAWYRKVFDPTVSTGAPPQRFWRFRKFYDDFQQDRPYQDIDGWLRELAEGTADSEHEDLVASWRQDPLDPHRVARLRPGAYARAIVMRSIETMVQWAEARFRAGDWEGINEATQLYLLAREILGPRPRLLLSRHAQPLTYAQLASANGGSDGLDAFGNALVATEGALSALDLLDDADVPDSTSLAPLSGPSMLYFGIPTNDQLLKLWDRIDTGLAKIRAGLDIRGEARLSLPPGLVAPFALNQPSAVGSTQGTFASSTPAVGPSMPSYRFQFMLQKAYEFAGEVRTFGAAVLAAYEKRDAEEMARLRAGQELTLLNQIEQVRLLQIQDAEQALNAAKQGQQGAILRQAYYRSRGSSPAAWLEHFEEVLSQSGFALQGIAAGIDLSAALSYLLPQILAKVKAAIDIGAEGGAVTGGGSLGDSASQFSTALKSLADIALHASSALNKRAGYLRRGEEWEHQADLAATDIEQFERQIEAGATRVAIAKQELSNYILQRDHSREGKEFLEAKFSNQELYEWMLTELVPLHYQSYQLALDLARQAEYCFRYERLPEVLTPFVTMDYWDDIRKGLMAAEKLQQDLRRLERTYLEQNRREFEITRHISLSELDPVALIRLREEGSCFFHLPEAVFDADHPGHYLRRIKTLSLSIPCISGPYTSINGRFSLERSAIRVSTSVDNGYRRIDSPETDPRFLDVNAGSGNFPLPNEMTTIVTSGGQADAGLFEANLRDERYLPFEGAGAISTWRLELPKKTNRFDPATISDVALHLRYTARDGGSALRGAAWEATFDESAPTIGSIPPGETLAAPRWLVRLFSVRHDFPDAWHRWLHPADPHPELVLDLDLSRNRFPYYPPELSIIIKELGFVFVTQPAVSADGLLATLAFAPDDGAAAIAATTAPPHAPFAVNNDLTSLVMCTYTPTDGSDLGSWKLQIRGTDNAANTATILDIDDGTGNLRIVPETLKDLFVLCTYELV
jgi:hypothetical protein